MCASALSCWFLSCILGYDGEEGMYATWMHRKAWKVCQLFLGGVSRRNFTMEERVLDVDFSLKFETTMIALRSHSLSSVLLMTATAWFWTTIKATTDPTTTSLGGKQSASLGWWDEALSRFCV